MNACPKWKDPLLDYSLGAAPAHGLEEHVAACPACSTALAELRARATQLDTALHQLVRAAEPSPALRARLWAAIEGEAAPAARPAWAGILAATIVFVLALVFLPGLADRWARPGPRPRTSLTEWRSPTESLLRSPGETLLRTTPRLGEAYFPLETIPSEPNGSKGGNNES